MSWTNKKCYSTAQTEKILCKKVAKQIGKINGEYFSGQKKKARKEFKLKCILFSYENYLYIFTVQERFQVYTIICNFNSVVGLSPT